MRQIKFRAWDKEAEAMHYSDAGSDEAIWQISYTGIEVLTMQVVDSCPGGLYHDQQNKYQKADVEIMQFTGITDKNGKEIYEGDIVKGKESGYENIVIKGWDGYRTGEVVIKDGNTYYTVNGQIHQLLMHMQDRVVLGNIHEHPDLLK